MLPALTHAIEQAAELHDPKALLQVGVCYISGRGVELSEPSAFEAFERAAQLGDTTAQYNAGRYTPLPSASRVHQRYTTLPTSAQVHTTAQSNISSAATLHNTKLVPAFLACCYAGTPLPRPRFRCTTPQ